RADLIPRLGGADGEVRGLLLRERDRELLPGRLEGQPGATDVERDGLPLVGQRQPGVVLLDPRLLHGGARRAAIEDREREAEAHGAAAVLVELRAQRRRGRRVVAR